MDLKPGTHQGLIVAAYGRRGLLETADGHVRKFLIRGRKLQGVCGDHVTFSFDDRAPQKNPLIVSDVSPRRNALERQSADRARPDLLASNLTLVIVVFALEPQPDWFLLDRYICTAELMSCKVLLVNNKIDLPKPSDAKFLDPQTTYQKIGYQILQLSANDGSGMSKLARALDDQTGILVGQSGVGKSSLINRLVPEADVAVQRLSEASAEGVHTTTASAMHHLPSGGRLIDTPGVREFIPAIYDRLQIQSGFREILALADDCRFKDCRHLREPNCAVKSACDAGNISPRRYESYKRLMNTINKAD